MILLMIIGKTKMDSQGRVNLSGMWHEKMPEEVILVVNPEWEMIEILDDLEGRDYCDRFNVDVKGRLCIPKWIRDELDGQTDLFLIIDKDAEGVMHRLISPKTGKIL